MNGFKDFTRKFSLWILGFSHCSFLLVCCCASSWTPWQNSAFACSTELIAWFRSAVTTALCAAPSVRRSRRPAVTASRKSLPQPGKRRRRICSLHPPFVLGVFSFQRFTGFGVYLARVCRSYSFWVR